MGSQPSSKTEIQPMEMVWSCTKNIGPKNHQVSNAMETSWPEKSGEAKGHMGEDHSKKYDWEEIGPSSCRGASWGLRRVAEVRC